MIKICHVSDWHGEFHALDKADLYIVTGDMLRNYITYVESGWNGWGGMERLVEPDNEALKQRRWMSDKGSMRRLLGNKDAPVVIVRGNHDFTSLAPLFRDGPVFEINEPEDVFEFKGFKIGGCRGINWIVGEWSDELHDEQFDDVVQRIPKDLDILVTHAPPWGIRDKWREYGTEPLGSKAIARYVTQRSMTDDGLLLHCFGHIHESCGKEYQGKTLFSNAATTVNYIELNKLGDYNDESTQG